MLTLKSVNHVNPLFCLVPSGSPERDPEAACELRETPRGRKIFDHLMIYKVKGFKYFWRRKPLCHAERSEASIIQ